MGTTVLRSTLAQGNVARLSVAQALAGANTTVVYATAAVIGNTLAPEQSLATMPISVFVVGMALSTLPTGAVAQRYGRRASFLLGTACGVLVGLLSALAIMLGSFWLFCFAMLFGGAYAAVVLTFRFAAAECVGPPDRARALSTVMAAGIVAGVLGPQLVTHTMYLWPPHMFAVTYLAQALVALVSAGILLGVKLPIPTAAEKAAGRPLGLIVRQPAFIVAVICGVISYTLMNFLMTSAPLAMRLCGLPQEASNLGLQWHVIAMYGPSFFTGRLITRFGAGRVVMAGLLLTAAAAAAGLAGLTVGHFWTSLILLGLGWNFGFVGASALVLECHRPEERNKVQAFNDFLVFGTMVLGSFSSGGVLANYGWDMVCWIAFPPLVIAMVALASRRRLAERDVARA
ncbi:MFS transporter [Bordetella bronchialis]|uniref:MFS transporter n=1 Tax=Bordetella bronchialis TaxID=463025 RepID=UPI003D0171C4